MEALAPAAEVEAAATPAAAAGTGVPARRIASPAAVVAGPASPAHCRPHRPVTAAPTSRPDNPNGGQGFVQITFDLGSCNP